MKLENYLAITTELLRSNNKNEKENGLNHLRKHLCNIILSKNLDLLLNLKQNEFPSEDYPNSSIEDIYYKFKTPTEKIPSKINLNTDPYISTPWNKKRLLDAITEIGSKNNNPFSEKQNHTSVFFYPIGITEIVNGTHSSSIGSMEENSTVTISEYKDISDWYDFIYFDGKFFIHKYLNKIIYYPEQAELGILYEIGRLILEHQGVIN